MSQRLVIESVYPKIRDFFKESGLPYEPKALDRTKVYFDAHSKDRPITKRINAIYRYKGGSKDREYIYYNQDFRGENHVGNRLQWDWIVGKVDVPYAHYTWVEETHSRQATEVEGYNTEYEIPFNKENIAAIEDQLHNGTRYYVTDGDRVYGGLIDEEMFRTWKFEDLAYLCKTGIMPGTQVVSPEMEDAIRKAQEEKRRLEADKQKLEDDRTRNAKTAKSSS